jgi:flagellar basal body-associated protein FliL
MLLDILIIVGIQLFIGVAAAIFFYNYKPNENKKRS